MKNIILKQEASSRRDDITKAYHSGSIKDYISSNALSIERNEENDITHIVFTIGGPFVYLDFEDSPGVVIAKDMDGKSQAAISLAIWSDIRNILEEL